MKQLVKKIKITTTIELLSGMHIGGGKDNVEIGGIDLPVVKLATKENQPYIPGSSLKGKLRCLLEQRYGIAKHGEVGSDNGQVRALFGYAQNKDAQNKDAQNKDAQNKDAQNKDAQNKDAQPSCLIVRDAMLTQESKKELENSDSLDMPFTENKFENSISRVTGKAEGGLRQTERVPAGAKFNVEFIINVWDDSNEKQLVDTFKEGIALLGNDYLGGGGSRGYGQICFHNWEAKQYGITSENETNWLNGKPYELGEI